MQLEKLIQKAVVNERVTFNYQSLVECEKKHMIEEHMISPDDEEFDINFELKLDATPTKDNMYSGVTSISETVFGARPRYVCICKKYLQGTDGHISGSYSYIKDANLTPLNELADMFGEEVRQLLEDNGIYAKVVKTSYDFKDYDEVNHCPAIFMYICFYCTIRVKM